MSAIMIIFILILLLGGDDGYCGASGEVAETAN